MPIVEYIKNVAVFAGFVNTEGSFSKLINSMPSSNPDEVVVRAINWNGQAADTFLYLVWCNLTNDFIASFCGGSLAPHFPQTRIMLNSPVPSTLEFKLYGLVLGSDPVIIPTVHGDLAIHLDFIKYKKTPVHA